MLYQAQNDAQYRKHKMRHLQALIVLFGSCFCDLKLEIFSRRDLQACCARSCELVGKPACIRSIGIF
jgi:hypothetical protein